VSAAIVLYITFRGGDCTQYSIAFFRKSEQSVGSIRMPKPKVEVLELVRRQAILKGIGQISLSSLAIDVWTVARKILKVIMRKEGKMNLILTERNFYGSKLKKDQVVKWFTR
jgi:hypothetical protein